MVNSFTKEPVIHQLNLIIKTVYSVEMCLASNRGKSDKLYTGMHIITDLHTSRSLHFV